MDKVYSHLYLEPQNDLNYTDIKTDFILSKKRQSEKMHDISEFLTFLLEKLSLELSITNPTVSPPNLNSIFDPAERNQAVLDYLATCSKCPIERLIGGATSTAIYCRECQDTFHSFESFSLLPLAIPQLVMIDVIVGLDSNTQFVKICLFVSESTQFAELLNRVNAVLKQKKEFKLLSVIKDTVKIIKRGENVVKFYNKGYIFLSETVETEGFNWILPLDFGEQHVGMPIVVNLQEEEKVSDKLDLVKNTLKNRINDSSFSRFKVIASNGTDTLDLTNCTEKGEFVVKLQRMKYKFKIELSDLSQVEVANLKQIFTVKPKFDKIPSVQDCLTQAFSTENFEKGNLFYCKNCCKLQLAQRVTKISKLPNYLMIMVKRYSWENKQEVKSEAPLEVIVDNLDLSPFSEGDAEAKYDLVSLVNHYGSTKGGHYTTVVRNEGIWFEFLEKNFYEVDEDFLQAGSPYLLLYKKTN